MIEQRRRREHEVVEFSSIFLRFVRPIGEDGPFKQDEHVIPFGVGKRYCLGQTLAEKEYFLFLVGILQKFDISPAPMQKTSQLSY